MTDQTPEQAPPPSEVLTWDQVDNALVCLVVHAEALTDPDAPHSVWIRGDVALPAAVAFLRGLADHLEAHNAD